MTEQQKDEIKRLRQEGFGYKRIAGQIGISENSVKSFCHRNNLAGRKQRLIPKCRYCGKRLTDSNKSKKKKFCDRICKQKWWNQNRSHPNSKKQIIKICPGCGQKFASYISDDRKFCSHVCYIHTRFKGGDSCESQIA